MLKILGVTATPIKVDGKGLGKHCGGIFEEIVIGATVNDLISVAFNRTRSIRTTSRNGQSNHNRQCNRAL